MTVGEDNRSGWTRDVRRVTWIGLVVNVVLSVFKVLAGWLGNSQAVLADGVHSLSDTTTDVAVLVGVHFWSAPADENHPHGHARIEALVTVFIGVVLAAVAVGLCYQAIHTMGVRHDKLPTHIAIAAAIASIFAKEGLYRYTIKAGQRLRSQAMIANAWHHRSDALSSIPATVAVVAASFGPRWVFMDHVGALVVSVFILQAAWKILRPALHELTDGAAPPVVVEEIRQIALETEGVLAVHKIRTRLMGSGFQVDLHILVADELTVLQGHVIAGCVRRRLRENGPDLTDVIVHIEPFEDHGPIE